MDQKRAQELLPCFQHFAEHGVIEVELCPDKWRELDNPLWSDGCTYRIPVTQDTARWDVLPDWVMWIARNETGRVVMYSDEPHRCALTWHAEARVVRQDMPINGFKIHTPGTCDWKDSLIKRPVGE